MLRGEKGLAAYGGGGGVGAGRERSRGALRERPG
jgi:hypothetical protein